MNSSESLVKSSFFDDIHEEKESNPPENLHSNVQSNNKKLWIKIKETNLAELNEKILYFCTDILYEGKLMKKSKKYKVLKHKYFVLYKDRLELYDVLLIL